MLFTNYKNFDFPKNFKGFKIFITPDIKTFKIYENSRSIEISRSFKENLNGHEKYFLLLYCVKFSKLKTVEKATNAAINAYKLKGLPEDDILSLLHRINEHKKIQKLVSFYILQWLSINKIKLSFYKFINSFKS